MATLSDILLQLDKGNIDYFKNLSEEELKELAPFVLMKFMSATKQNVDYHLIAINEVVNKDFWQLKDYKDLQLMLLAICGTGKRHYHYFPGKGRTEDVFYKKVRELKPLWKHDEIEMFLDINTKEQIIEFFKMHGLQDKELKSFK